MLKKLSMTAAAGALMVGATAIAPLSNQIGMGSVAYGQSQEESSKTEPAMKDTGTEGAENSAQMEALVESGKFIVEQAPDEVSANRYIGKSVYNLAEENVGDINDLIFATDGGIHAAVVGVGGFLGLGEKNVAVRFDAIDIQEVPDSPDVRLVIDASKEQLEQAPGFITKAQQLAEARRIEREEEMKRQVRESPVNQPAEQADQGTTSSITE